MSIVNAPPCRAIEASGLTADGDPTMATMAEQLKEQGRLEGKLEGRLEGKLEDARAMLLKSIDLATVLEITGLTEDRLREAGILPPAV
jgi:predicted transposase/invertase (TIGR01784 family)